MGVDEGGGNDVEVVVVLLLTLMVMGYLMSMIIIDLARVFGEYCSLLLAV